jgi:hypothetical protein
MLSIGPGAPRISPSQNIPVTSQPPAVSVMYITDGMLYISLQSWLSGRRRSLASRIVVLLSRISAIVRRCAEPAVSKSTRWMILKTIVEACTILT